MVNDTQRRMQDLLVYPREDLGVELKDWLDLSVAEHRADLAKAIMAHANSGGGYILIGFTEAEGSWSTAEGNRPPKLEMYSQDEINGIVERYAEPPIHCEVYHLAHPETGAVFPIVKVPGDHRVPVRSKRDGPDKKHVRQNEYYIRRPGPKSETPRTGQEWDDLINRCIRSAREEIMDGFRGLLFGVSHSGQFVSPQVEGAKRLDSWIEDSESRWRDLVEKRLRDESSSRFAHGVWSVSYAVTSDFDRPSLVQLREILVKVQGRETGWPPWWVPTRPEIAPYVFRKAVECWLVESHFEDAAHSDFWRASPSGMLFLLRGYQEDSKSKGIDPGTIFDLTLPIWRIGECLLHAERFATTLAKSEQTEIVFEAQWQGLENRVLTSWANPRRDVREHRSRESLVKSRATLKTGEIRNALAECVKQVVDPVYEIFDFFSPSIGLIQEELATMRGGR